MPAVHAGDRIGMNREGEVLVNSRIGPPDALGIRVARLVRAHASLALDRPPIVAAIDRYSGGELPLAWVAKAPSAHMVTTGDDTRTYALGDPSLDDKVSDRRLDSDQITRANP
jgi:hypothetical protein